MYIRWTENSIVNFTCTNWTFRRVSCICAVSEGISATVEVLFGFVTTHCRSYMRRRRSIDIGKKKWRRNDNGSIDLAKKKRRRMKKGKMTQACTASIDWRAFHSKSFSNYNAMNSRGKSNNRKFCHILSGKIQRPLKAKHVGLGFLSGRWLGSEEWGQRNRIGRFK